MFFLFKMYLKIVYIFDPILLCVDVFLDAIVVLKGLQSGRLQSPSSRAETKETPDQNQQHQPGDSEGEGTEVTQTHACTHTHSTFLCTSVYHSYVYYNHVSVYQKCSVEDEGGL